MAAVKREGMKPLKRVMAGCLVLGLYAVPSLAKAEEAAPNTAQAAPLKALPKAKSKARVKPAAASKRPVKPTDLHAGAALLPPPQPLDAQPLAARKPLPSKPQVASGQPAPAAPLTAAAGIPLPPGRPQELAHLGQTAHAAVQDDDLQTGSIPVTPPTTLQKASGEPAKQGAGTSVDALISKHAARYNVPEGLLRRVVARESGFNPRLRHGPFVGLMQMRLDTARGMGYRGNAEGLLDADTNLTYGAAYLANAWKVAGGSQDRAVRLYSSGYYYEAKRKGLLPHLIKGSPNR